MNIKARISGKTAKTSFRILRWLATETKVSAQVLSKCVRLAEKIIRIGNTRGLAECITYSKSLRSLFLESMLSMKQEKIDLSRSSSLPKILKGLIRSCNLEDSPLSGYRLVMTTLYFTRFLKLPLNISFKTISERSPDGVSPVMVDDRDIKRFLKEIGNNSKFFGKRPRSLNFKAYHLTSKSGPTGHALWNSFFDAHNLSVDQLDSIKIVGGDRLYELILKYRSLILKIPQFFLSRCSRKGDMVTRKLVGIQDKEGKTREVAIMDYFTQAALLPLHNLLMKALSRIVQDCTLNQSKHIGSLRPTLGSSYHSIDLTAATDRFPIVVIERIFCVWFGEEYSSHWKNLMVGSPFHFGGKEYSYAVGNPMGAYSSFNGFAIAHHFLVFLSCQKADRNWKKCPYMLLGDDIVIADDSVAKYYKQYLKEWGVPYNETKTHTSLHGYEFAKQIIIHDEMNVSPFPMAALLDRSKQAMLALGIIYQECHNKDWCFHPKESLYTFLTSVLQWSYPRVKNIKGDINMYISLIDFLSGRGTLGSSLRDYVVHRSEVTRKLPDKAWDLLGHYLTQKVMEKTFLRNRDRIVDSSNKKPLGQLAVEMTMAITSTRDGGMDCFDLIESIPFLQIYGRAEEVFLKLQKHIPLFFGITSDPKLFRKMYSKVNIPLSDEGFYLRHRDVLMTNSVEVSKTIKGLLAEHPKVFDPKPETFYDPQLGWYYS
jgi:hypothetical protein